MKWLFLLLGVSTCLSAASFDDIRPSTSDEIASLNANLIVDGFVSAMSGQLSLSEVDLCIKGAQDLSFERTYVPPRILGCYDDKDEKDKLILGRALLQLNTKGWTTFSHLWAGYNQNSFYFQVKDPQGYVLEFEIQGNKGVLKTLSYGCSNLRSEEPNSKADIRNIELLVEDNQVRVTWPDGIERVYTLQFRGIYRLDHETLPNGKVIRYQWNHEGLARVLATDVSGQYIYAYLDRIGNNHFKGSDGREVKLNYEAREIKGKVKSKKSKEEATYRFSVMTRAENPVYSNNAGYNERALLNSYDSMKYPISCNYSQQKDCLARIQTFSTPSGSISFSYDPPVAGEKGGSTTVSYPDGASVVYRFNASLLLSGLENWFEGKLCNQKVFTYDDKQHISKIEIKDGNENILLTKTYECDQFGNPLLETRIGDFGTFSIKRTFSKNRLISEERDDGVKLEYSYLGNTHLPLSKTTFMNGKSIRRTLYSYDEANNLIEKKEVGKTVTTYHLNEQAPHLHRIHFQEERDWNGNLIHKTEYRYDQFGNISQENHYGSDGNFAYSIERIYDEKGNLLKETNPLGQKASFVYDKRNRPIKEIPFSNRLTIERVFDGKGRLIHLKEGDHQTRFSHNASDELTQKIDYLGLITNYTYHPVHGKPVLIEQEPTIQEITYDAFGREIRNKNAYGAVTQTKPNSYGDPLEIIHPDGGKETFTYAPNGLLIEEIDPDGLKTCYSYDPLSRLLSKKRGVYETNYIYDAYHLIEERDPLGISVFYTYNLADQKIKEEKAGRVTEFTYDPLGFLSGEFRSGRKTCFTNDVLGRVLKKNIDGLLKTTYTYDSAGNIASIANGDPIYYSYDPYDRLIEKINGEREKITFSYEEGDRILIKKIVDPNGIETIETYNAHGLLLRREIPGITLEEFGYDRALRLTSQDHLEFIYTSEGFLSSMREAGKRMTHWTYSLGGKVQSKIKPDGTVIFYGYNSQGELIRMGSREFQYDALGRLIEGSGFKRELDPFGNILKEELGSGLTLISSYDAWNRPLERILPDGSQIYYEYGGPFLRQVIRKGISHGYLYNSDYEYTHTYNKYSEKGLVLEETGVFSSQYSYDKNGRCIYQQNPYFEEELIYDFSGNLIQKGASRYTYDRASQLTSEKDKFKFAYDQHYNRTSHNGEKIFIDDLNQRKDAEYDLNGNLLRDGFVYDEFDQLIQTKTDYFTYDALGRRLANGRTSYFYIEDEEIGSFKNGQIEELKILGIKTPIAIEIKERPYAPIVDVQNTIRQLVDYNSGKVTFENSCDAFGKGLTEEIPYAYAGKRYDGSSGLVYFGKRFYDPNLGRWLIPDPLGAVDHSNLYQYVFNNPFKYYDPNGESLGGYLLGVGEMLLGGTIVAGGFALEVVTVGGFTFGLGVTTSTGMALMGLGLATTSYHAQDIKVPNISWKNTNVYAPDRPLPLTEDGIPIPETDVPHTQLGTRDGSKGKYPQAREFGKDGKPMKGIDFTDHGRPWDHPNPHEHPYEPNPTGGTPGRGNAKPLENWRY